MYNDNSQITTNADDCNVITPTAATSEAVTTPAPDSSQQARIVSSLSSTLSSSAENAYQRFTESGRAPEWMTIIRMASVIERDDQERPLRTAFIAALANASMGYTLHYTYCDATQSVTWATAPQVSTQISGSASFQALGPKACMMQYTITIESESSLPAWGDPMFNGHPASAVLCEFRDFMSRNQYDS